MEVKRLGKYEVRAKIGQGAMGEVYRGYDPVLGREVAIKTIAARVDTDAEIRKRFEHEARSAARLNHPNIITIHDFGEERGLLYMAMELLDGEDLKNIIASGRLTLAAKLDLIEQVCEGLAYAHAEGVIHRDLKPANIHITSRGKVKVLDFGLARLPTSDMTRTGIIMGTPNYMSPEQVRAEKVTVRSDVFSLGSVFYELLGGHRAFDAESLHAVLFKVLDATPEPLEKAGVAPVLGRLVEKAMRKEPSARFSDAGEMLRAIQQARASLAAAAEPGRPGAHPGKAAGAESFADTRTRLMDAPFTAGAVALDRAAGDTVSAEAPPTLPAAAPTQVGVRPPKTAPPRGPERAPARTVLRAAKEEGPGRRWWPYLLVIPPLVLGVAYLLNRSRGVEPPAPPTAPSVEATPDPAAAVTALVERTRRSLEDKDPRAAQALAEQALRSDPTSAAARELLEQARSRMRELETALEQMEAGLAAADSDRASRAFARVVAIDPRNPAVASFAGRLNEAQRARAEQMRRESERAARAVPPPPPARSSASATPPPGPPAPAAATPPPPLPPVAPAPTPAPTPAVVAAPAPNAAQLEAAARQAIRGVLDEYRGAFEARNADALRTVQPSVDYEEMKAVFARVTAFNVKQQIQSITVTGSTATVTALVTYSPVPKPAGKIAPVPTIFHLRKTGEVWVIERVTRK